MLIREHFFITLLVILSPVYSQTTLGPFCNNKYVEQPEGITRTNIGGSNSFSFGFWVRGQDPVLQGDAERDKYYELARIRENVAGICTGPAAGCERVGIYFKQSEDKEIRFVFDHPTAYPGNNIQRDIPFEFHPGDWYYIYISVSTNNVLHRAYFSVYDPRRADEISLNAENPVDAFVALPVDVAIGGGTALPANAQLLIANSPADAGPLDNYPGTYRHLVYWNDFYLGADYRFYTRYGYEVDVILEYQFSENVGQTVANTGSLGAGMDGLMGDNNQDYSNDPDWSESNDFGVYFKGHDFITIQTNFPFIENDATKHFGYGGLVVPLTVSFWIKVTETQPCESIIFQRYDDDMVKFQLYFAPTTAASPSTLRIRVRDRAYETQLDVQTGVWTFIAVSCNQYIGRRTLLCIIYADYAGIGFVYREEFPLYLSNSVDKGSVGDQRLPGDSGDYVETTDDIIQLGDRTCSFKGYLNKFRLIRGSSNFMDDYNNCRQYARLVNGLYYDDPAVFEGFIVRRYRDTAANCAATQYFDKIFQECTNCDYFCNTCTSGENFGCGCNAGFASVNNGPCVCPDGEYFDKINLSCEQCNLVNNCEKCFGPDADQCLSCTGTLYLFENQCVDPCPEGYYRDAGPPQVCSICDDTCKTCQGGEPDQCTSCAEGTYLVNGVCVTYCPIVGFFEDPTTNKCNRCHSSCLSCDGIGYEDCTACPDGSFLYRGECLSTCPLYYFGNTTINTCLNCESTCQTCSGQSEQECTSCEAGFYLYELSPTEKRCVRECPESFFENDDHRTCQACHPDCLQCYGPFYYNCEACDAGSVLHNATCLTECPDGYYEEDDTNQCWDCFQNCKQCNSESQFDCTACFDGYYLSGTECVSECPAGEYGNDEDGLCTGCSDPLCDVCQFDICTECSGTNLLEEGVCVNTCDPLLYYPDVTECLPCHDDCVSCFGPEADECTSCDLASNRYLYGTTCYGFCPENTENVAGVCTDITCGQDCFTCKESPDDCTSCMGNYFLYLGSNCVDICPTGYYHDYENRICRECDTTCLTCIGPESSECTSCQIGDALVGNLGYGYCQDECESSQYFDMELLSCTNCHPSCSSCSDFTQMGCYSCAVGYKFNSDRTKCVVDEYVPDDFFEWLRYYSRRVEFHHPEVTRAPWFVLFFGVACVFLVTVACLLHHCFVRKLNTVNVIEALVRFDNNKKLPLPPPPKKKKNYRQVQDEGGSNENINSNQDDAPEERVRPDAFRGSQVGSQKSLSQLSKGERNRRGTFSSHAGAPPPKRYPQNEDDSGIPINDDQSSNSGYYNGGGASRRQFGGGSSIMSRIMDNIKNVRATTEFDKPVKSEDNVGRGGDTTSDLGGNRGGYYGGGGGAMSTTSILNRLGVDQKSDTDMSRYQKGTTEHEHEPISSMADLNGSQRLNRPINQAEPNLVYDSNLNSPKVLGEGQEPVNEPPSNNRSERTSDNDDDDVMSETEEQKHKKRVERIKSIFKPQFFNAFKDFIYREIEKLKLEALMNNETERNYYPGMMISTKKDPPKVEEFVNPGAMGDGMDAQADENIVKNSAKREIIIEDLRKDQVEEESHSETLLPMSEETEEEEGVAIGFWEYVGRDLSRHHGFIDIFTYQSVFSPSWIRAFMLINTLLLEGIIVASFYQRRYSHNLDSDYLDGDKKYLIGLLAAFVAIPFVYIQACILRISNNELELWKKTPESLWEARYYEFKSKMDYKYFWFVVFSIMFLALCLWANLVYELDIGKRYDNWMKVSLVAFAIDLIGLGIGLSLLMATIVTSPDLIKCRWFEQKYYLMRVYRTMRIH